MRARAAAPARALLIALLSTAALAAEPRAEAEPAGGEAAESLPPVAALPDARALALRAEDVLRGQGSAIEATMTVVSGKKRSRSRVLTLRLFDDRLDDRALVRVLSPEDDAGAGLLKLPPNLWDFSPRKRETTRIPSARWLEPFLDSDFTRDDLVRGSSGAEDYDQRILEVDERAGEAGDHRAFVVEYTPHPDAAIAWARIVAWIDAERATPLRFDFYGADGALARTLRMSDLREVAGRSFPYLWVMRPPGAKGRETRIQVDSVHFDPRFDEGLFTTRRLAAGSAAR